MQVMAPKRPSLLIRPLHEHGDQRSFEAIRGNQRSSACNLMAIIWQAEAHHLAIIWQTEVH